MHHIYNKEKAVKTKDKVVEEVGEALEEAIEKAPRKDVGIFLKLIAVAILILSIGYALSLVLKSGRSISYTGKSGRQITINESGK